MGFSDLFGVLGGEINIVTAPLLKGELKAHIHISLYESNTLQE